MTAKAITDECGVTHYFDGAAYRGWQIGYNPDAPATGLWKALRHGVGLCSRTREELLRNIDQEIAEEEAWRRARA